MIRMAVAIPAMFSMGVMAQTDLAAQSSVAYWAMQSSAFALVVWMVRAQHRARKEERKAELADRQASRKEFTETLDSMANRHDKWETQRHKDSDNLNKSLNRLAVNCAKSQAARG